MFDGVYRPTFGSSEMKLTGQFEAPWLFASDEEVAIG